MNENWSQRKAVYDPKTNMFYIDAHQKDYDPAFLKYLLQHLELPANCGIIFIKDLPQNLDN